MKIQRLAIALALTATVSFAVSKDELSLSAQNSIKKMERAIEAAKKTAVTELTDLMKNEMKAGKIDSAVTLDKIIKSIDTPTPSIIQEGSQHSEYIDDILGSWEMEGGRARLTFNKDGSCTVRSIRVIDGLSTWEVSSKKLIVTNKKTNVTETYDLPPKKINFKGRTVVVIEGKSSDGSKLRLFRRDAD